LRVTTDLWVSALLRRASAAGAFATVMHKGAAEAGAVHVIVNSLDGMTSLLGPAAQFFYTAEHTEERLFEWLKQDVPEAEVMERIVKERSFDPDIWVVEIEDRQGRPFVDTIISS